MDTWRSNFGSELIEEGKREERERDSDDEDLGESEDEQNVEITQQMIIGTGVMRYWIIAKELDQEVMEILLPMGLFEISNVQCSHAIYHKYITMLMKIKSSVSL